ncbi:MAG TPA: response regulator [Rhizomicrobium sp.]|nr:response regulator [Rhizomicrobium sp.]
MPELHAPVRQISPKDIAGKPAEPVSVAIVDDDSSIRNAVSRFLKSWDLRVNAYSSCVEFMHALAEKRPDCLLLDLHMPEFDGIAVMNHLNYMKIALPVIIISAEEETKFRDVCHSLGAVRYLRKPVNGAELLSAIEDAVAGAGRA